MRKIYKLSKLISILLLILLTTTIYITRYYHNPSYRWYQVFLTANFGYLFFKVTTSFFYKPTILSNNQAELAENLTISAIIPCYNESLDSIKKVISSLLNQTVLVNEIIFIDDGSDNDDCYTYLCQLSHNKIKIITHRFSQNKGKKTAIEYGILHAHSDLLLMLDSDGEIIPTAVRDMRSPFVDSKVGTVCGRIMVRNYKDSFWTHMQEIVYFNSFEVGRASQSLFNDVVVASGALSMHRKCIFDEKALSVFRKSRFFGINCIAGDDRLLTDLSKYNGYHSVYQNTAICYTDVPNRLSVYFKQQVRWLKSAYLQSLFSLRHTWKKPLLLGYQLLESYLWLVNLIISIILFVIKRKLDITVLLILIWIVYSLLVALFNAIKYRQYGWKQYLSSAV